MIARTFIDHVESALGGTFLLRGDALHVLGLRTLPHRVRETIRGNRVYLIIYLRTLEDVRLTPPTAVDPKGLGLVRLENGEWTDVRGDDARDAVLMGVLEPVDPYPLGSPPRKDATPIEVYPGRYRWAEERGIDYRDPFPNIPRI